MEKSLELTTESEYQPRPRPRRPSVSEAPQGLPVNAAELLMEYELVSPVEGYEVLRQGPVCWIVYHGGAAIGSIRAWWQYPEPVTCWCLEAIAGTQHLGCSSDTASIRQAPELLAEVVQAHQRWRQQ